MRMEDIVADLADVEDVEDLEDVEDVEDVEGDELGDLEDVGDVADIADVLDLVEGRGDELGDVGRFRLGRMLRRLDPRVVMRAQKIRRKRRGRARRRLQQALARRTGGGLVMRGKPEEILLPFEPTIGVFDSTHNTLIFRGRVQRRFRPQRLVIDQARFGETAVGLVHVQIAIGVQPQAAAIGGFPAAAFGPTAVSTRLALGVVDPAIDITLSLGIEPAPQVPADGEDSDRVLINLGFIGPVA